MIEGTTGYDHGCFTFNRPAVLPRIVSVPHHPSDEANKSIPILSPCPANTNGTIITKLQLFLKVNFQCSDGRWQKHLLVAALCPDQSTTLLCPQLSQMVALLQEVLMGFTFNTEMLLTLFHLCIFSWILINHFTLWHCELPCLSVQFHLFKNCIAFHT